MHLILLMDKGVIAEQGTHEEPFAKGGFYTELDNSQLENKASCARYITPRPLKRVICSFPTNLGKVFIPQGGLVSGLVKIQLNQAANLHRLYSS